jgi:hypothetical protein
MYAIHSTYLPINFCYKFILALFVQLAVNEDEEDGGEDEDEEEGEDEEEEKEEGEEVVDGADEVGHKAAAN